MASTLASPPTTETLADLVARLGNIPLCRIRARPAPGLATEEDLLAQLHDGKNLYELVDGALVEKAMGFRESLLALALGSMLRAFVLERNLGLVSGADGIVRLFPGLTRIPDVAFVSWERIPEGRIPEEPIADLVPDLAVEVLSAGNTPAEMARKRREYFAAGVRVVWIVDPNARTVAVYSEPERFVTLDESANLEGGEVLPGFTLSLRDLFAELDRHASERRE
ncbi:MAG: Uma2 family endonuclease [Gemmataceae bacterium]